MKLYENPSNVSPVVICGWTDGRKDRCDEVNLLAPEFYI